MQEYIKSPLNYVGGKNKLLPQIIPLFPDNISTFVDLFTGGANVSVNVKANRYIVNDAQSEVIQILRHMWITSLAEMLKDIDDYIYEFDVDRENKQG